MLHFSTERQCPIVVFVSPPCRIFYNYFHCTIMAMCGSLSLLDSSKWGRMRWHYLKTSLWIWRSFHSTLCLKDGFTLPRESFSYGLESSFQADLSDMGSGAFLPSCITSVGFHLLQIVEFLILTPSSAEVLMWPHDWVVSAWGWSWSINAYSL